MLWYAEAKAIMQQCWEGTQPHCVQLLCLLFKAIEAVTMDTPCQSLQRVPKDDSIST